MFRRTCWSLPALCALSAAAAAQEQPQPLPQAQPQPLPLPAAEAPPQPAGPAPGPLVGCNPQVGFAPNGAAYGAPVGYGQKYTHSGWPYGPRVAPPWSYPGLPNGPFVTYPGPGPFVGQPPAGYPGFNAGGATYGPIGWGAGYPGFGFGIPGANTLPPGYGFGLGAWPWFSGRSGSTWSNGLSLYGPPVPVYGPIPGVFGNYDLVRQWRTVPFPGLAGYGWHGIYRASPRPRPLTVSAWPQVEPLAPGAPPVASGGCMLLSVQVPQPAAEVFVDGKKTAQTGTDRTFESPPLEAGKSYRYTVTARWVEGGQVVEAKKEVTGTPGEVVRVDFGR
jgi:uncharacterized protein (TIGR03000 family)